VSALDGTLAKRSLFQCRQELPSVLRSFTPPEAGGVLLQLNPHGNNEEGWTAAYGIITILKPARRYMLDGKRA